MSDDVLIKGDWSKISRLANEAAEGVD